MTEEDSFYVVFDYDHFEKTMHDKVQKFFAYNENDWKNNDQYKIDKAIEIL